VRWNTHHLPGAVFRKQTVPHGQAWIAVIFAKATGHKHVHRLTSVPPLHKDSQPSFLLELEPRADLIEVVSVRTEVNTLAFIKVHGMSLHIGRPAG